MLGLVAIILFMARVGEGAQRKMEFRPMLRMESNYQDNVFFSEDDPQSGYIINTVPGISCHYISKRSRADLEYQAEVKYYSYDTGYEGTLADENYSVFQDGRVYLETRTRPAGRKGIEFSLDERYRDNQLSGSSQIKHSKYFVNTVEPEIGMELSGKIKLLGSYEHEMVQFNSTSGNDSTQYTYSLEVEYYKSRRSFLSLGYNRIQKDFDKTSDYTVNEGELAFRRIFNRTWSGGFSLFYQMRDYTQNSHIDDWSGLVTKIFLSAVRQKKLDVNITYQLRRNSFDSAVSYRIDRGDIQCLWRPFKKLSVEFSPFYQQDTYDYPQGREDSLWGGKSHITYQLQKHISLGIGYEYADRDSNKDGFSYQNNVYQLFFSVN